MESVEQLKEDIRKLANERGAVILAHNYQIPEIQAIADYVGDSFGLCKRAQQTDAKIILFCGVYFMAETAAILNPDKRVLIPDPTARCPMAAQLPASLIREAKARHPGVPVVLYVNTLAEAKAEATVTCTSSNICQVFASLDSDTILFGPDANMSIYARHICKRNVIPIPKRGFCHVHVTFGFDPNVLRLREKYPGAEFLAHPECDWEIQQQADFVGSTEQMVRYAKNSSASIFIIATEVGLVERMRREIPSKTFIPALDWAICKAMKKHTLAKVKASIVENKHVVTVPEPIAQRARQAIERMLEVTR